MGKGDKWRKGHSLKKFGNAYDEINWGDKTKVNPSKIKKSNNTIETKDSKTKNV